MTIQKFYPPPRYFRAHGKLLTPLAQLISPSGKKFSPKHHPEEIFRILGVSNDGGIFFKEEKLGENIEQNYIRVSVGDLVYNPHRVNVGSIGIVPSTLDGGIVSGIYVVFRPNDQNRLPSEYILRLLKSDVYLRIIRAYDTRGSVRANLSWKQLCRIKLIAPTPKEVDAFIEQHKQIESLRDSADEMEAKLSKLVSGDTQVKETT